MSRRVGIALFLGLLCLALATFSYAQTQTPEKPAPPAAAVEKPEVQAPAPEKKPAIPEDKKKHTTLGLSVTAKEAYDLWQKDQDKVKILDCRTPEEYAFVGHASMAVNIPRQFMNYRWNPEKKDYLMKDNPKFVQQVKKAFKPTDTILVKAI